MDLEFVRPAIDWHAIAPEIVLTGVLLVVVILDLIDGERFRLVMPTVAGVGLLVTLVPALTLAVDGTPGDVRRCLRRRRLRAGTEGPVHHRRLRRGAAVHRTTSEGDYYENEYYTLLLSSLLGMVIMASSRDLITMFIALELLSIPAYMLAAWRKGGLRSNEAGMKYYLMGVFATAVMLYGMSFVFGAGGSTVFTEISVALSGPESTAFITVGILFVLFGFAFKVSAVPFHTWAPDTYEGAPTPITAFLSVGSKTAGFVALLQLVFVAFVGRTDVDTAAVLDPVRPDHDGRQPDRAAPDEHRAHAGLLGCGPGGIHAGRLGRGRRFGPAGQEAVVIYLIIYAFMNLGAFAVVMAVARKTRSGEITSYGGLISYAPGLTAAMTVFLFALAGIPPLAGWFAKFTVFRAVIDAGTTAGYALGVIMAVNSVIALVTTPTWPRRCGSTRCLTVTRRRSP